MASTSLLSAWSGSRAQSTTNSRRLLVEPRRFRAVRGEYGSGKTFFVRWLAERARRQGFATSEVQISETETPLHRHETVYRRIVERLSTPEQDDGALRSVLDAWFYALDEDVLAEGA